MSKIIETKILDFSRGMTSEPREKDFRYCRVLKNFDAHSYGNKLVPFFASISGDDSAATNKIQNFEVAPYDPDDVDDYRIYGLGFTGTKAKVFVADLASDVAWTVLDAGTASSMTAVDPELFIYYAKTKRIYGACDGTTIWCVDPQHNGVAFDETGGSDAYAYTLVTRGNGRTSGNYYEFPRKDVATNRPYLSGLVHSKDDILYITYDNIIIKNNGTTWSAGLTLPTDRVITSICEYGNYLAIATKSISGTGNSVVYLWDRDSTITTLTESIDWGEGNLQILEQIEGGLVGVSISATTATVALSRITLRYWTGGQPIIFRQLVSEAVYLANDLSCKKRKVNNFLYFPLKIKLNGITHEGIWKVGKNITTGQLTLSIDRWANNDTALTNGEIHGFHIIGDIVRIAYTTGGVVAMAFATYSGGNYTATSIYESLIMGESYLKYKLKSAGVMFEKLLAGGEVKLKYRIDGATSWTEIFDETTDGLLFREAINLSDGTNLPEFREIEFQITSLGGAVITGFWAQAEEIDEGLVSRILKVISGWFG